ncbi:MAG: FmdB family zinc ribbon protein [Candidatus Ornithospirochaeta sp.]|nr:FmdB family zinc ribbon protein [Candidatus Ornithospirochaeta sp.]
MPIYEYRCTRCGKRFELIKSFSDDAEHDICPDCKADANRIFSEPAQVVYHGSGYYCTDHKSCPGGGEGCSCGK